MSRRVGVWMMMAVLLLGLAPSASAQGRTRNPATLKLFQANYAELRSKYVSELKSLIETCRTQGLADAEVEISRFLTAPDATRILVASLPKTVEPEIPLSLPAQERQWRTQLLYQRQEYAKQLYLLSRRALHGGFPGYAYDLVRELAVHDPDHAKARELLGYVRYQNEWVTPFARKMLLAGNVWHDEFGWLPRGHVDRYVAGERNVDGRWMSAEKETVIRSDFHHAWEIQTDHYLIRTNYSLERGVELGRALEDFHEFFHQTFAGFFNDPEQLQKIFDGSSRITNRNARQYLVHYYRSQEEYIERLEPVFPAIKLTNGIYLTGDRTAHFYFDPKGAPEDTLFHEATHQLFYESTLQNRPIAEKANFWIVEGIACYMESFRRDNGTFSVGDPAHIRFAGARMNLIDKEFYVPLREYAELGSIEFQQSQNLPKMYTQAAGLAHFFMQYDGGKYRDALVAHLAQIYSGNARKREFTQGLNELSGVPYHELDAQYAEWLRALRAQERGLATPAETVLE